MHAPSKKKLKKKREGNEDGNWTTPCLNQKIMGVKTIKACPITSDDMKKQLVDEYHASKRAAARSFVREPTSKKVHADEGRFHVMLENQVDVIALGDYGSCFAALPMSLARKQRHMTPDVSMKKTTSPVKFALAIKNEKLPPDDLVATNTLTLDITIVLTGSNIPARLRRVKFLVVNHKIDEILSSTRSRPRLRNLEKCLR